MIGDTVAASVEEIQTLLRDRLRIRGETLVRQIDRAGRLLPRAIAREARYVAQAEMLVQNPKLARMVDPARLDAARNRVAEHLRAIDPARRRKDRLLRTTSLIALQLLIVAVGFVTYLVWRGIV